MNCGIREIQCIANKQIIQASCDEDTCREDMSMPVSKKKEHTIQCVLSFYHPIFELLSDTMVRKIVGIEERRIFPCIILL